jgi:hypothetical protein
MFHGPLAIVKDVLVHGPLVIGVGPSSVWTTPDGAGDVVGTVVEPELPVGAVVDGDVVDGSVDVVVALVVPDVEPLGAGSV